MSACQTIRRKFLGADTAPLDIHDWRDRLLTAILMVALVMGTLTAVPSILQAWKEGQAAIALVDFLALAWVVFVWRQRSLSFHTRAWSLLAVLYAVGLVLLVTIGPVSQIYLMAFPVMAALLLGLRAALFALAVDGVTLLVVGYLANADFQVPGFQGQSLTKWAIITANFMFVDSLIAISCAALLRGLEKSLERVGRDIAERKKTEALLRASEESFRQITSQVPGAVFRVLVTPSGERQYRFISPGVRSLYGVDPEAVLADPDLLHSFIHPDDLERIKAVQKSTRQDHAPVNIEYRVVLADGTQKWLHLSSSRVTDPAAGSVRNGVIVDITERKLSEEALRANEARWKLALESTGDGVWDWDLKTRQVLLSARFKEMCGYAADEFPDELDRMLQFVHPDDVPCLNQDRDAHLAGATPTFVNEHRVRCMDGSWKWFLTRGLVISREADGTPLRMIGTHTDISGRKQTEALIWQQANYDGLTGLPNRQMLRDRLEQDIKKCKRDGQSVAVMFIDLDHFKEVNDTLGHDHGDLLLVEAAHRIRHCIRDSDTVARLGGDEFTVVLPELDSLPRVEQIAQDIIAVLAEVFQLGHERAYVSASIGITFYPDDATDIDDLFKQADQAMYVAKDAGRSRFSYFTPALQEAAQTRVRLTNDLRQALTNEEFKVFYQPIVDLQTGRVHKAEALIRWQHPTRGLVSPAIFIPIAESSGLINEIGDWVFRQSAAQARDWRARHQADFQISVNKSPVQFRSQDNTLQDWFEHLRKLGLPGRSMVVEITEGLLLDASSEVSQQLVELRQAGIGVSLDDFGTGYSSLSYLQKFDIDFLKIDQAFVRGLAPASKNLALCKAIILMAHELGMQVIAEGVETDEQRSLLTQAGCDFGQGYHFARPMPAEDFEHWYATRTLTVTA
ncbi:putative bifunctional diguanylate cyclase/phosphodiesterase [Aquabacterium sp.]|uniref:putative bifunctional diguanylate cyclase/phosphodiesterase n=1 Tax=Aquabacterium sp. TaxID=1872578 RepID=UPI003D6CC90A